MHGVRHLGGRRKHNSRVECYNQEDSESADAIQLINVSSHCLTILAILKGKQVYDG
jgi:hypothetical protein